MKLSCECDEIDDYNESFYLEDPVDYVPFPFNRGRKCHSCETIIRTGEDCVEFELYRTPTELEIETEVYPEGLDPEDCPRIESIFHCEECGGVALSVIEAGYCVCAGDDFRKVEKKPFNESNT